MSAYPEGFSNWPLERRNEWFADKANALWRKTAQRSDGAPAFARHRAR